MDTLILFLLIFLPMAIIIGIASSTIGFTAWNIAVPLLFVGFGFNIFDALFVSIAIDFMDASVLTVIYAKNGKVDFKAGALWLIPTLIGALIALLFMEEIVTNNTDLLRGSVGYVIFLIASTFLYKGYKESQLEKNKRDTEALQEDLQQEKKSSGILNNKTLTLILMGVGSALSGALGGLLGIGSGMNFVLLFIILYGYETLKATGTGCFMMAGLMLFVGIFIFPLVHFGTILPYLLIAVSFSVIGTTLGSKYALKLPKSKLNYMVGIAMILAASAATIQALVL